ncbi:MAG: FhaA domain-containing protein [Solirubrobacteraceae bacterium]
MSVLRNFEDKIAGLVEGTFGRVFRTQVRPVEIARKLTREMDEHKTISVSRTYVPNEYVVWLSPEDHERFDGVEREVTDELTAYLLEHARRERLALVSRPKIEFRTDERLHLGEFGIQARLVREAAQSVEQADHGHTMVYSTSTRAQEELHEERSGRVGRPVVVAAGKRYAVPPGGATLGRSRDCDIVLADSNVSRKHAEIRPRGDGWTICDLGSTNGVRVNGRQLRANEPQPLSPGDSLDVGTDATFEVA